MSEQPPIASTTPLPADSPPAFESGCLVYVVGGDDQDRGASATTSDGELIIGSGPECSLVLEGDTAVSRRHLRLRVEAGEVVIEDLGSTNGTYYLGQRIERVTLRTGARLRLGSTDLDILPPSEPSSRRPMSTADRYGDLLGTSLPMRRIFGLLEMVEQSEAPVLVQGDTGTGKELVARAIHAKGPRKLGPFVTIDCAAIPKNLIESELFGHKRGAFTGATETRDGAFLRANRGTVFLDEIGELPLELQPRLLRVLETGQVKRVGDETHQRSDFRIIAATHRPLDERVENGTFRQDLFYRLAVIRVRLPALRERRDDIPMLAHAMAMAATGGRVGQLPRAALDFFMRYDWPGNVRELRNAVARVLTLGELGIDTTLPEEPLTDAGVLSVANAGTDDGDFDYKRARKRIIDAFESAYLRDLIGQFDGNISAAARAAGIDRKHIRQLLEKHGLRDSSEA